MRTPLEFRNSDAGSRRRFCMEVKFVPRYCLRVISMYLGTV